MKSSSNNDSALLRVGPTPYMPGGIVTLRRDQSDEIRIVIVNDEGEPLYTASVALLLYGAPDPGEFGVWLKGWSENEGVPEALVTGGVVTLTGRKHNLNFCEAEHAELTEQARTALIASEDAVDSTTNAESLGDGVYVQDVGGMLCLFGNAFSRKNVIFLEPATYSALQQWARRHNF